LSPPDPAGDAERRVVGDVEELGWHGVSRFPGGSQLDHYYTVGLRRTYGAPEILIVGLAGDVAHGMARAVVDAIGQGASFAAGERSDAILEGYDVGFSSVGRAAAGDWLPLAAWYYGDDAWEALQLLWPDRAGRFPGEEGYDDAASPQDVVADPPR
jgi:Domain of unknown function (DUF4262)